MNPPTATRSLQLAAGAWRRGVPMNTIIVDGWSRGFHREQTIHECVQAGYAMCICVPAIISKWMAMDAEVKATMKKESLEGTSRKWWARFCGLQRYSFFLNGTGGVRRVADGAGAWVGQHEVALLVEAMQDELNEVREAGAKDAAKRLTEQLVEYAISTGVENYTGMVFNFIEDGGKRGEVLITVQFLKGKTPHDLKVEAEQRAAGLVELLRKAAATLNNRRAYEEAAEIEAALSLYEAKDVSPPVPE